LSLHNGGGQDIFSQSTLHQYFVLQSILYIKNTSIKYIQIIFLL